MVVGYLVCYEKQARLWAPSWFSMMLRLSIFSLTEPRPQCLVNGHIGEIILLALWGEATCRRGRCWSLADIPLCPVVHPARTPFCTVDYLSKSTSLLRHMGATRLLAVSIVWALLVLRASLLMSSIVRRWHPGAVIMCWVAWLLCRVLGCPLQAWGRGGWGLGMNCIFSVLAVL